MLARMSRKQFNGWMAEHSLDPWGDDWYMAATIASTIYNMVLNAMGSKAERLPPRKFIPYKQREQETHQGQDAEAMAAALNAAFGPRV